MFLLNAFSTGRIELRSDLLRFSKVTNVNYASIVSNPFLVRRNIPRVLCAKKLNHVSL